MNKEIMKKITTVLLSMLVMTSTLTMGLPIFSNEVKRTIRRILSR